MSPDEQNIQAFAKLIESQPLLFSNEDQVDLWRVVSSLENNAETISDAIAIWSKSRSKIRQALLPLIGNISQTRSAAEDFKKPDPKDYNKILLNAMRVSFPNVESQQQTPQQPSNQKPSNSQP
ncbi:hypothetical protein G7B40_005230 [Aetokthonos hydrillicola Thurmond2011]|jgi:hypothetical protein|uniref:Uncharacterized protein n=1 Tax=Aetokthonos hydrillicola Thurmond2011 TaxID=2712845 RepID=A0AAP5M6C3_9CYAN|nr:hypothetical protein [Aetokthonos hydrillicola]MBO3457349.1 hypothetical protein [Aetokthonos hydrillicola CCALA 1050]MBW4586698.1 hypothetical protein [Aetokthonos hydrillicola CCALA 1050]MDR9893975.1 hypothetical protein [Aetokthonos hydrillicola Thurmond2011]